MPITFRYADVIEFGPNEPTPYADKNLVAYAVGTSTPVDVYEDEAMTVPLANSIVPTNEFGEVHFYSAAAVLDLVRQVGGKRSTHYGGPGDTDENLYARQFFLG